MGWLKIFGGAFTRVSTYFYIVLISMIVTLWFLNGQHVRKIEKQADEIVKAEVENTRLNHQINRQNTEVTRLKEEGEKLKKRVETQTLIVELVDENGEKILLELDEEAIPKDHRGAFMWMIQKSQEQLSQ